MKFGEINTENDCLEHRPTMKYVVLNVDNAMVHGDNEIITGFVPHFPVLHFSAPMSFCRSVVSFENFSKLTQTILT